MTIADLFITLRRRWILLLLTTAVGAGVAFALSTTVAPQYRSSSSVLVTATAGTSASELVQGSTYIEKLVTSYALLARSEIVLAPVIQELDLHTSPRALADSIDAQSETDTVVIDLSGVDLDPQRAQSVVAAVTQSLVDTVDDLSPKDAEGRSTVQMTIIESASLPQEPFAPNKRLLAVLGGAIGLVIGVGTALIRRVFADTIARAGDLTAVTDVPVMGEIPDARRRSGPVRAVLDQPLGVDAEAMRGLVANLSFVAVDGGLRSLVVTSGSPHESKSSVAVALALTLAENGERVLLIDADLRSPSVAAITGLDGAVGLTTVLVGDRTLGESIQEWGTGELEILTSGVRAPNPVQLLRSDAMATLIQEAVGDYDFVVIDSAPVLNVTDPLWVGRLVDGILVTSVARRTRVRTLQRTLVALADANLSVVGLVLTRVSRHGRTPYGEVSERESLGRRLAKVFAPRPRFKRRGPSRSPDEPSAAEAA